MIEAPRDPASLPQVLDDPLLVPVAWPLLGALVFGLLCGGLGFALGDHAGQLRGRAEAPATWAQERLRAVRLTCARVAGKAAARPEEWLAVERVCASAATGE